MNCQFVLPHRTYRYSYHERPRGGKSDEVGDAHFESGSIVRGEVRTFSLKERMLDSDEDGEVKGMN